MKQFEDGVGFDLFGEVGNGSEAELRDDASEVDLLRGVIDVMPETDAVEFGFGDVVQPEGECSQHDNAATDREEQLSVRPH